MNNEPAWMKILPQDAFDHILLTIMAHLKRAHPKTSDELHAAFASMSLICALEQVVTLAQEQIPDAVVTVIRHQADGERHPNLHVQMELPDKKVALGAKIFMLDLLFEDWEKTQLGLRPGWRKLLARFPNGPAVVKASSRLSTAVMAALADGMDAPLRFRVRLMGITATVSDPQEREAAHTALLAEFPQIGMRSQSFSGNERPSTAEVNRRFQTMPFKRGK